MTRASQKLAALGAVSATTAGVILRALVNLEAEGADTFSASRASTSGQAVAKKAAEPGMVQEVLESSAFKSFLRSAATVAGREITRSILGTGTRRR